MATSSRKTASAGPSSTPARRPPLQARSANRDDTNLEAIREALERSVTLSRERIQEVVDDAVRRGRMTRDDANELVSKLLARGRAQTDDLVRELERLLDGARGEVETRTTKARKSARKAAKSARVAADEPLARADKIRRRAGVGSGFPITGYDELTVAQIRARLDDLDRPELRQVRTHERASKARKGVIATIDKRLG